MANIKLKKREAETRRVAQMMKRILIHFRSQMDEQLKPEGVTTAQVQVLKAIRAEPDVSGARLARFCYVTPQSAQAILKSLEVGGWIRRAKDPANDRILIAKLTASGVALLDTVEKLAQVIERKLWHGVPDSEVEALGAVLERCLENLEDES